MWTLEYDGVEQPFADWGIVADVPFEFQSQAADSMVLRTVEDFDDAWQFEADEKVIVRRDRSAEVGGGFSGGTIFFQGYVELPERLAAGPREYHSYTIYGPWRLLERCQLQQVRKIFNGWTVPGDPNTDPTFLTVHDSELTLGEAVDETSLTNGQVITALIEWANECWNPTRRGATVGMDAAQDILQVGTIGVTLPVPKYPVRDLKVAEGIRQMLRWSQDAIAWVDHSTVPPTFNVKKAAVLPAVSYNTSTTGFRELGLRARYDRQIPGVIIRYKKTKEEDGRVWTDVVTDKYPLGVSEYNPDASVHTIDLLGERLTHVEASVEVELAAPTSTGWWQKQEPTLAEDSITNLAVVNGSVTVKDAAGAAVSLATYPNVLLRGQLADWMGVVWKQVTVTATVSYKKKKKGAADTFVVEKVEKRVVSCRVVLTDATSGTYRTVSEIDEGEAVPVGLAQGLYDGFSTLQYEGRPSLVAADVPGLSLGKTLTIVTPGGTYAGLLVQAISGNLGSGTIQPLLGPPGHIGLTDMVELLRVNRFRMVYSLPSHRSDGQVGASAQLEFGKETPKENTTGGVSEREKFSTVKGGETTATLVQLNSVDDDGDPLGEVKLGTVDASTGALVADQPRISLALTDLPAGVLRTCKLRLLKWQDYENDCVEMAAYVLMTEPEVVV